MIRIFLTVLFAAASALAQTASAPAAQPIVSGAQAPSIPSPQQPAFNPDNVPPNAPVVTVHGVCGNNAASAKPGSCETVITKEQFKAMLEGMNVTSQISTPAAMRSFAESYTNLLALADAGEKAGFDKDPHFLELIRIGRIRALAESYRHSLDEKFSNPSPEEIEAYYKENIAKYEALKVERIIIPNINPNRTPAARSEFEKQFQKLANDIHERAARGEETQKLQDEAYKALSLPSPPRTDLGLKRKGGLPAGIEKDLFPLRPGEVTRLEPEMSGLNIYKLRSRDTIPLEFVKAEIVRDLHQKNMEAAIKSVTGSVHSDLNDQFFGQLGVHGGPMLRAPQPSDSLYPKGLTPSTPIGAAPATSPANSITAAPASGIGPASQKIATPK
jgi:PPIC-type PPIASE domain